MSFKLFPWVMLALLTVSLASATVVVDNHGQSLSSSASVTGKYGERFLIPNATLINTTLASGSGCTVAYLLNQSMSQRATTSTLIGLNFVWNINLTTNRTNESYYVTCDNGGLAYTLKYLDPMSPGYPISGTNIVWEDGINAGVNGTTQGSNFQSITTERITASTPPPPDGNSVVFVSPPNGTINNSLYVNITFRPVFNSSIGNDYCNVSTNISGTWQQYANYSVPDEPPVCGGDNCFRNFVFNNTNKTTTLNFTTTGRYLFGVECTDVDGNKFRTENRTLIIQSPVNIYIHDESTGLNITNNVSLKFSGSDVEFTNITNTSALFIDDLPTGTYQVFVSSSGKGSRTYTITTGSPQPQNLHVYLSPALSKTIFTIIDQASGDPLYNVLTSMYRIVDGNWTPVESKTSDITGKVELSYLNDTNYKFYLSKSGYTDKIFYLNPVLFSSYDIKMARSSAINYSQDYDGVSVIYAPTYFNNGTATDFNIIFSAPSGDLSLYGFNLTYEGGIEAINGSNTIGSQLTSTGVTVLATTAQSTVKLDYFYVTSVAGRRDFSILIPVTFSSNAGNMTFTANRDKTYGLGILERVLVVTFIVLFVMGIATLVGQPIPGAALVLLLFGYMAYIGFVPIWVVLPSIFIGFLFVVWKSGGY